VSHDNKKFNINAKHHILSLGCLESNRIILNTFKNESKFLEKYKFGEGLTFHPTMNLGTYNLEADFKIKDFCKNFDPKNRIIFFKQNDQTKLKGINSAISLSFQEYRSKNFLYNKLYLKFIRKIKKINLSMCFEHLPSNNSKITLSENFDKNGIPKINLNTEIDQKNISLIEDSFEYYINILNKIKIGKSIFKKNDFKILLETGNHHHGGLNFGNENTPTTKDFSLQNFKNLYINGSALFPTSSIYGPTLTIIACSYLLFDVIKKKQKL